MGGRRDYITHGRIRAPSTQEEKPRKRDRERRCRGEPWPRIGGRKLNVDDSGPGATTFLLILISRGRGQGGAICSHRQGL